jgi:hypothetical protein
VRRIFLLTVFLLGLSCGAACSGTQQISPPSSIVDDAEGSGFSILLIAEGEVQLKRTHWADFHPTSFGAMLYRGDQIKPALGAKAVVLCSNLSSWLVPAGAPSGLNNGCPESAQTVLLRGKSQIGSTRGGTDPLLPFIISPRATKLLNSKPILSWNPAPGANSYTIYISGLDWEETVDTTEVAYPGDPPLLPDTDYLLVVETDDDKSSKNEGIAGLGFGLLSDTEAQKVRADEAKIRRLNLSEPANTFAIAQVYASHKLYAEAIQMLEKLVTDNQQTANVYRALGELYQQVGLIALAESRYSNALDSASSTNDLESLAAIEKGLGEAYTELGNKDEAVHWLTQAKAGYEKLGDGQLVEAIEEELKMLNP